MESPPAFKITNDQEKPYTLFFFFFLDYEHFYFYAFKLSEISDVQGKHKQA